MLLRPYIALLRLVAKEELPIPGFSIPDNATAARDLRRVSRAV